MRISARAEYALLALMELSNNETDRPIQSREISSRAGVPKPFLDQLLLDLRRSGLVRSVRGPGGGYVLARTPGDITVRDAMAVVEGSTLNTQCGIKSSDGAPCKRLNTCALMEVWNRVDDAIDGVLATTTLADLAERQREYGNDPMYHI
ncbi:MAG: Rrf2 family transcriptional regulator [Deltaproteobacteria bacterium]|nr:Rrf2 family transcriptional regulator [Deltaproteobacteria bacterium]